MKLNGDFDNKRCPGTSGNKKWSIGHAWKMEREVKSYQGIQPTSLSSQRTKNEIHDPSLLTSNGRSKAVLFRT